MTTTGSADAMFSRNNRLVEEIQRLHLNAANRPAGRRFTLGVRWSAAGTTVEYLYQQSQLICRTADIDTVLEAFRAIGQQLLQSVMDGPAPRPGRPTG